MVDVFCALVTFTFDFCDNFLNPDLIDFNLILLLLFNGGFGKQGHQMAVASFAPKSKYIHQIYLYTVHSIISCIHSKASIKFINPFQIRSN